MQTWKTWQEMGRRAVFSVLALVAVCLMTLFATPTQAAPLATTSTLPGILAGYVFGGSLTVPVGSSVAEISPLFSVAISCNLTNGTQTASGASMNLGIVGSTGAVTDTLVASHSASVDEVTGTSQIVNVSLLGGLIKASSITSTADAKGTPVFTAHSGGATFVSLQVGGASITAPAPNTTIVLGGGAATLRINEQVAPAPTFTTASISVNALHLHINQPFFGLPVGADLIIGHAQASYTRTTSASSVSSDAYGFYAKLGPVATGPLAQVGVTCFSGSNSNTAAAVTVPGVGAIGAMSSTASGSVTSTGGSSSATSTVASVSLLAAFITGTAITANTSASANNGVFSQSSSATVGTLRVGLLTFTGSIPANTIITNVAGLEIVLNNRVITTTSTSIQVAVNAIDIFVLSGVNPLGLPVGTRITVGHSVAEVSSVITAS